MNIFHDPSKYSFSGGRIKWDTMLQDTFAEEFSELMSSAESRGSNLNADLPGLGAEDLTIRTHFTRALVCGAFILERNTTIAHRFDGVLPFLSWILDTLPDLRPAREDLFHEAQNLHVETAGKLGSLYSETVQKLQGLCFCKLCRRFTSSLLHHKTRAFCLAGITEAILSLLILLADLVLDTPLLPTYCGILSIYEGCVSASRNTSNSLGLFAADARVIHHLTAGTDAALDTKLAAYAHLFSGARWETRLNSDCSARSDGKLYCYIETLREPTDCIDRALLIHIGSGSIQYESRLHDAVFDQGSSRGTQSYYPARNVTTTENISVLAQDTSSTGLAVEAMVEDRADILSLWYRISSKRGTTAISPARLLMKLTDASHYLISEYDISADIRLWQPVLSGGVYTMAEGEGGVEHSLNCLLLRPLRSNLLGRCIAITKSEQRVALVKNDDQLVIFAKFWAFRKAHDAENTFPYYAIVS